MVQIIDMVASIGVFFGFYAILALSLNLEFGYAGLPNFGKVAFQAIGAMIAGWFSAQIFTVACGSQLGVFSSETGQMRMATANLNPILAIVVSFMGLLLSMGVGALFGYLVSYPALRLGRDYLAVSLLVFGEMLRLVVRNWPSFLGGSHGLGGIPNPVIWIDNPSIRYLSFTVIVLVITFMVYVVSDRLANSPYGRVLRAVRDNESAAECYGKRIRSVKGHILAISNAFAGLAGGLYVYYTGYVNADDFTPLKTFDVWLMVLLGGSGNNKGVILGVLIITIVDRLSRLFSGVLRTTFFIEINYVRYIAMAIIMLIIIARRPAGIIKEKPIETPALEV